MRYLILLPLFATCETCEPKDELPSCDTWFDAYEACRQDAGVTDGLPRDVYCGEGATLAERPVDQYACAIELLADVDCTDSPDVYEQVADLIFVACYGFNAQNYVLPTS